VACVQYIPFQEYQTSFLSIGRISLTPPITHILLPKTTELWPSRTDQPAESVAEVQWAPSAENQTSFPPPAPERNPPITQIFPAKSTELWKDRGPQGAASVVAAQWMPSEEYQTSLVAVPLDNPPITHIFVPWTTEP